MLSDEIRQRLFDLEQLAWQQAKTLYERRYIYGIDCPRLNELWSLLEKGRITRVQKEKLYQLLFCNRANPRNIK